MHLEHALALSLQRGRVHAQQVVAVERVVVAHADDLERRRETNEYWLAALAGVQTDPRRLNAIRTSVAQVERVSAADVRQMAQTYLLDAKAWKLEVTPVGAP